VGIAALTFQTLLWFGTFLAVTSLRLPQVVSQKIELLGRYTLYAYLVQMPIARTVHAVLQHLNATAWVHYALAIVIVGVCTVCLVAVLDNLRGSRAWIDESYRAILA
jgi:hypothetical protein